ncbi:MAG TPA: 1,4-alpha-glucan branching protein GlgB [Chromatiaceae bacterium]|jgi:1,4-alpha-glucan branching enzyme|nr:1,4-alpha-glucan branching protein GlgB [Chromatiaceae bacterium]
MSGNQFKSNHDVGNKALKSAASAIIRVQNGRHHDPFEVLGLHPLGDGRWVIRCILPHASDCRLYPSNVELTRIPDSDIFEVVLDGDPPDYEFEWTDHNGVTFRDQDPYRFTPQIPKFDLELFTAGEHLHAYRILGAHQKHVDNIDGICFAVWAPNAERVSVIGGFNQWDGRCHPMRVRGSSGVWELFIPGVSAGELYKYEIRHRHSGTLMIKADPYGQGFELRPGNASIVQAPSTYDWGDANWIEERCNKDWQHTAMSIYEVHLGSWRRDANNWYLNYRALADSLVDYVTTHGFTHVELLPVCEHPLDESWGYQVTGYFAPTSRFGSGDDFRYFVNLCHQHGIGVILDWVPGHFPKDEHALARFDGVPLYEHADPQRGEHQDWGTLVFDYGRDEVRNFLISNAIYWMQEFHIDGLRVDAVASMLYLDYSRDAGEWTPNIHGGRGNLDAIEFLRKLNIATHREHPGTLMIAEESTSWPQVSQPVDSDGLGFSMKWNMGWMHDVLDYFGKDPIHRQHHHDRLTFGMLYAFSENFVLPFSHDEVVHEKASMIGKMPGDDWQRFANLRLLYTFMFTYPGKKLLFMGSEFGQSGEWRDNGSLDWELTRYAPHSGLQQLITTLNHCYRTCTALHEYDFESRGFNWLDCEDTHNSIISYQRLGSDNAVVSVALNMTPIPRQGYRLGVCVAGEYREIVNSDHENFGGSNMLNSRTLIAESTPCQGQPFSIIVTLPPLAGVVFQINQAD